MKFQDRKLAKKITTRRIRKLEKEYEIISNSNSINNSSDKNSFSDDRFSDEDAEDAEDDENLDNLDNEDNLDNSSEISSLGHHSITGSQTNIWIFLQIVKYIL